MKFSLIPFLKRNAPTILTVLGVAGTVATGVISAKNTPKALQSKHDSEEEKGASLTRMETFIVMAPAYIPAAAVCLSTILCIVGSNKLNQQRQTAIMGVYTALKSTFNAYRKKAEELYGDQADIDICRSIAQDKERGCTNGQDGEFNDAWKNRKHLWLIDRQPELFERTKEEVFEAEYRFLRDYYSDGEVATLNGLYKELGLPPIKEGDDLGWSGGYLACDWGTTWIGLYHQQHIQDDGTEVIEIVMPRDPIRNFLSDPDGCW